MEENKIDKEEETKKIEDQKSKKNDLIFSQLTDLQYNDFKTNFDKYDADGSGEIDPDELRAMLKSFGQNPSDKEFKEMVKEIDEDGSGEIDFGEFC